MAKKDTAKNKDVKIRKRKVNTSKFNKDTKVKNNVSKKKDNNKFIINKTTVTLFIIFVFDLILTVCMARKNIINCAVVLNKKIMIGNYKYLLLGRNYINIIIMLFFYVYVCLVNKLYLKNKNTLKFLLLLLIFVVFLNLFIFYIFSNRVY